MPSGISESELKAYIEHVFAVNGASAPAYDGVVAAGSNGLTLHYPAGEAICQDGEMVLIDAGWSRRLCFRHHSHTACQRQPRSPARYLQARAGRSDAVHQRRAHQSYLTELNDLADLTILQGLERLGFDIVKSKSKSKGRLTLDDVSLTVWDIGWASTCTMSATRQSLSTRSRNRAASNPAWS